MKRGDECFFYHSKVREIVGIVKVVRTYYLDETDPRFGQVDVEIARSLKRSISLQEIKTYPQLLHLPLLKQSRLSVMPIDEKSWDFILEREPIPFL